MNELNLFFLLLKYVPPIALVLLIGLWVFAVLRLKGRGRPMLLLAGCSVFLLAAILFGGQWLLAQRELVWRQWMKSVLALLLWCAGAAVSCLLVYRIPRGVRPGKKALRLCLRAAAALCAVIAMGSCTLAGGFWLGPVTEKVIVYRGVKAVQEEMSWLDAYTVIYEYHSPFTRGTKAIGPIGG